MSPSLLFLSLTLTLTRSRPPSPSPSSLLFFHVSEEAFCIPFKGGRASNQIGAFPYPIKLAPYVVKLAPVWSLCFLLFPSDRQGRQRGFVFWVEKEANYLFARRRKPRLPPNAFDKVLL